MDHLPVSCSGFEPADGAAVWAKLCRADEDDISSPVDGECSEVHVLRVSRRFRSVTAPVRWSVTGKIRGERCDVVLIHGWGSSSRVWSDVIRLLESDFRIHPIDLPGYGDDLDSTALELGDLVSWVVARAPSRAVWLGWSLGGLVAMQVAHTHPEMVSSLIAVCSSPCFCAAGDWPGIRKGLLLSLSERVERNRFGRADKLLRLFTPGSRDARREVRLLERFLRHEDVVASREVLVAGLNVLAETDLRSILAGIRSPVLWIYGRLDKVVPCRIATSVDSLCSRSGSIVFQGAAHAPFVSHPVEFCRTVANFIRVHPDAVISADLFWRS